VDNQAQHISVSINEAFCKQCGICAAFCPKGVLAMKPGKVPQVIHPGLCTGCQLCAYRCPDFAIEVKERNDEQ